MNVKVTLVHEGATDYMKQSAARVIDGSLLKANSLEGRMQEAKAIYNRMMGIKSTPHPYQIVETEEPPYKAPAIPVSEAGKLQQEIEDKVLRRTADMLAEGIAVGVAKALAAKMEVEKPSAPAQKTEEVEQASVEEVQPQGTMKQPQRKFGK